MHRGAVEGEIAVDDDEEAALARPLLDLLHRLEDAIEAERRADHHLDRQAAGRARQRWQVEGEDAHAGDRGDLALHELAELLRTALAFVPRLQDHAGDAAV